MLQSPQRHGQIGLLLVTPAQAAPTAEQSGKAFARANCARCHAIDRVSKSPAVSARSDFLIIKGGCNKMMTVVMNHLTYADRLMVATTEYRNASWKNEL
jgi:cytochrome c5